MQKLMLFFLCIKKRIKAWSHKKNGIKAWSDKEMLHQLLPLSSVKFKYKMRQLSYCGVMKLYIICYVSIDFRTVHTKCGTKLELNVCFVTFGSKWSGRIIYKSMAFKEPAMIYKSLSFKTSRDMKTQFEKINCVLHKKNSKTQ